LIATWLSLLATLFPYPAPQGWKQEPALPDPVGWAGMAAGVIEDGKESRLIAAGGANFPGKPPWEGGIKEYSDSVWILGSDQTSWTRLAGKLPRPLAYAVSTSSNGEVFIAGGESRLGPDSPLSCQTEAFTLSLRGANLVVKPLPSLPGPIAYACGTQVGNRLVVAGGIASPTATRALDSVWSLDRTKLEQGWQKIPSWPGPERMLAVCAAVEGDFFLMGGTRLEPDPSGKPMRRYLKDAYRLDAQGRWHRLADLPHPVVAAASPAPVSRDAQGKAQKIWILSGDQGNLTGTPPRDHPGFAPSSLCFDLQTGRWLAGPEIPAPRVTLPCAFWKNRWWLVSGESRPGVRSPQVWSLDPTQWATP